jgi:hypothetical protein
MIRVGLPAPAFLRFRIRAQLAGAALNRQAGEIRQVFSRRAEALRCIVRVRVNRNGLDQTNSPEAVLNQFEERYQSLIDLLCWSAKDGVKSEAIERYQRLRDWFLENYDSVRPVVTRHLEEVPEYASPYNEIGKRDAFECLFLQENLHELINSDSVIPFIQTTRCALDQYRASLTSNIM